MTKDKPYDWSSLAVKDCNIDSEDMPYFNLCVSLCERKYSMVETIAEAEIKSARSDYLKHYKFMEENENNRVRTELSDLHIFFKRYDAKEIDDCRLTLHYRDKNGKPVKVNIQTNCLLNSFINHFKITPDPKRPSKAPGRPKGPQIKTLVTSMVAIILEDRYKNIVTTSNERHCLIGLILIAINAIDNSFKYRDKNGKQTTGDYLNQYGNLKNRANLIDNVENLLFKV